MLMYAHRGLSGQYPENTMLAFRQALTAGVDGIELDVHVTADRVPVVIHDRDVGRTTNGLGVVDAIPLATLQTLDAGQGERVPTLAEVLDLVSNQAHLDIEIKGRAIEPLVLATLADYPAARWAISSFDWDILREIRRLSATAELWPLAERVDDALFAVVAGLGSPAISLYHGAYTSESAAALRDGGVRAVIWTVNDGAEADRVRGLGAYALCTDVPEQIIVASDIA